jgi:hypothetical protein
MQGREKCQSRQGLAVCGQQAVRPFNIQSHKLDLLQNALDSLAEALAKFEAGDAGDPKSYKFSVLHMAHFIELVFKHHITEKHPLLIYTNPFAQKLDTNKTIGLWEAINFINNEEEGAVSADFKRDLEWLKKLRNEIEHHKFEMDVQKVRTTMGRLFRSLLEFLKSHSDLDIDGQIPPETMTTFKVLSDEYEFRLRDALREAEQVEAEHLGDPFDTEAPPVRVECESCGNLTLVVNESSGTGYRCTFCGDEESDELPATCDICGAAGTVGDLVFWKNEAGQSEGRCYYCSGCYRMDKDD